MRILVTLIALFGVLSCALAQAPSMDPPAELKKLEWWLGHWEGKMNWDQDGMKADGTMKLHCEMDGQFQRQTSVIEMMGFKMTESAFLGWDADKKKYFMYTFTNFSSVPRIEWGEMIGNKMVMVSEPWKTSGNDLTVSRATITKVNDKEASFVLEFKLNDKWTQVATASLKKTK